MSFETDKQTLDDLNLLGKYKNNSVYSLYVGTITRGGERKMEDMFLHPLTDAKSINERSAVFRYFKDHDFGFPFGKDEFDVVEQYIAGASGKRAFMNMLQIMRAKAMFYISHDPEFGIIRDRIVTSIEFFRKARTYFDELGRDVAGNPFTATRISPSSAASAKQNFFSRAILPTTTFTSISCNNSMISLKFL